MVILAKIVLLLMFASGIISRLAKLVNDKDVGTKTDSERVYLLSAVIGIILFIAIVSWAYYTLGIFTFYPEGN